MPLRYFAILCLLLFQVTLAAQTISPKALDRYNKADQAYILSDYDQALEYCEQALKYDPNFDKPYLLMADIYVEMGRKNDAIATLEKMLTQNITVAPYIYLLGAKLSHESGKYEAMSHYLSLYETSGDSSEAAKFDFLKKSCDFALHAVKNPVAFVPENMGTSINSEFSEYLPCMTVDDETMIFTRRVPIERAQGKMSEQEDFFVSHWHNDAWTIAEPLYAPINTGYNEGAGTISADGRILIFTACSDVGGDYGAGRTGLGSCDLFYAVKEGDSWSAPQNFGAPINSAHWESQPSLSADGRSLYFIRGDKRKNNSGDIYVSQLKSDNRWGAPKKLPDNINSDGKEHSVFIHPDGKTLYFSSNEHPGMGGFDIFITTKLTDSTWSDPKNLGYPINTFANENSIMISGDGRYGYFAGEREGGFGKMDIYQFEIPKAVRPDPVSYLRGYVFDMKTSTPLLARFELIDLQSNEMIVTSYSDKINGTFLVTLPPQKNYALNVSAPGYLFYSDHFQMQENTNIIEPFLKNIPLQKIVEGKSVVLRNVFFEFNKSNLQPESQAELLKLVDFLQSNPILSIEIEGYTDNQGDEPYNQKLSEARAKAVRDFLVSKGIATQRLSYKGYGALKPIESNDTEAGRAVNRRTEFKVVKY